MNKTIEKLRSTPEGEEYYQDAETESELSHANGDSWDMAEDYIMPNTSYGSEW